MLTLRLEASVADGEKGLCAPKLAIFSWVFHLFGKVLSFPVYLVLVLSLRWPLDKTLQLRSTSVHCYFLMHCATPYLPGTWLVTRQRCIDLCHFEKLHCLGVGVFLIFLLLFLPLLGHRSHHLWFVFPLPLIWEFSWVHVHLLTFADRPDMVRWGWKCCP